MVRLLLVAGMLLAASGCETLGFYSQAVSGQLSVTARRQPVDELLGELAQSESTAEAERLVVQLELAREILAFARTRLGLEVKKKYSAFVQLDDDYVIWNVFAAPELALAPRNWCYPLVGCAPYRGYFRPDRAQRYARRLRDRGFETYVGGVAAYSTLGWFSDPLLSSFIYWDDRNLAQLLFHELAHDEVWVASDVAFNEAFATFVGEQGAREFLADRVSDEPPESAWPDMLRLLLSLRRELETVYALDVPDSRKRAAKQQVFAGARACYRQNRERLGGGRFDAVMQSVNNAYLVSLSTYRDAVPAFAEIFAQQRGRWKDFFTAVAELGDLEATVRAERLAALSEQHGAKAGDDHRAQNVQCEAFFGHGFRGEAAGAEDDDVGRGSHG